MWVAQNMLLHTLIAKHILEKQSVSIVKCKSPTLSKTLENNQKVLKEMQNISKLCINAETPKHLEKQISRV